MTDTIGFLFDLDGVLIDSEKEYTRIWSEIDRQFPSGVENLPLVIKGMTLVEIVEKYFPSPEFKERVPKLLYELENKMTYQWLPGARELLSFLNENGISAALVTSSNEIKMNHLRRQLPEAEHFFSHIVTGDLVKNSKPHPEGYLLASKLIGVNPHNCAVFEDSLQGVKAGRAAGAFVVGVEGTLPAQIISPFSDIVVDSLSKLDVQYLMCKLSNRINE